MEISAHHQMSDEYTELYSRVPLKLQLAYGIGHVLNDVCASMWFTYLLVFFHLVLEFSNWQTGFMLLIGQVADAIATPFVGYHSDQSDNFWFCGYGKRKIWHLFGTVCVLGAFPFIFSPCIGCTNSHKSVQIFYYSMFIIIFQFGWASVQISHLSLIPELTPNEHDRTKLTAIRYCFTVISNVLVYVITWIILHMNNGENSKIGPSDGPKFQRVVWSVLSLGTVCSLLFHIIVKEVGNEGTNNVRGGQLRTSVGDLLTNVTVYQVAFIYMASRLFVNLTQVFIPLYLHETLDMAASSLALVPLIMFIGSFITSMLIEKINRCCGRKLTYAIGAILGITACIWVKFGTGVDYISHYIYLVAILFGSGCSIILVSSLGVTTDLIGEKTDSGAFVYGIMSFADKLANGIAVVIIQDLHNDASNTTYYRDVLTNVCGAAAFSGALAVICLFTRVRSRNLDYESVPNYNSINN
ncbi:hypothetical protein NQ314_005649 [Rhamnusium bicolor]|uniref:Major facilitator superfamily domain-containing protein 12-like n=1 Tax=Rhamnusium bicolor TaxID=1586634 RepID=A0AAV8ZH76_9CUCU|nr:hypothetical protein NQ314_005649 [Rhamnusium bicolor]